MSNGSAPEIDGYNPNVPAMKANFVLILSLLLVASACSTQQRSARKSTDDVYVLQTTPSDKPSTTLPPGEQGRIGDDPGAERNDAPRYGGWQSSEEDQYSERYVDEYGNTYITNNYYYGDYYDSYTSRLYRWYYPVVGVGYYSPFYVGFTYPWYYSPGITMYFSWGYHVSPYYYPWYYPWYNPWYDSWYNPWYDPWYAYGWPYYGHFGWGYPYGSYWHGYWHGYYHGWNDGYYWGSGRYYYGYRGSSASNTGSGGRQYRVAPGADLARNDVSTAQLVERPSLPVRSRTVVSSAAPSNRATKPEVPQGPGKVRPDIPDRYSSPQLPKPDLGRPGKPVEGPVHRPDMRGEPRQLPQENQNAPRPNMPEKPSRPDDRSDREFIPDYPNDTYGYEIYRSNRRPIDRPQIDRHMDRSEKRTNIWQARPERTEPQRDNDGFKSGNRSLEPDRGTNKTAPSGGNRIPSNQSGQRPPR